MDPQYVSDIRSLAIEFQEYRYKHGTGQPDSGPDRIDDLETVQEI